MDYTARFDRWQPANATALRVTEAEIEAADATIAPDLRAALNLAAERIETFHRAQLPQVSEWNSTTITGASARPMVRSPGMICAWAVVARTKASGDKAGETAMAASARRGKRGIGRAFIRRPAASRPADAGHSA